MSEEMKYAPEDVIQQEGPNKGAVADESLARVGAEAEAKSRAVDKDRGLEWHDQADGDAIYDRVGGLAIMKEVHKRAYTEAAPNKSDFGEVKRAEIKSGSAMVAVDKAMERNRLNVSKDKRAEHDAALAEVRGKLQNF